MKNPIGDIYPSSPMQKGMLFQSLLNSKARLYHEQLYLKVIGELNISAFKKAWRQVVRNNAVLRTVFDWQDGDPIQIILNQPTFRFEHTNISSQDKLQKVIAIDARHDLDEGFDFEIGPLIRFKHFTYKGGDDHIFRVSYHHIILDGSSVSLMFEEFYSYYKVLLDGKTPIAIVRPIYKEYIKWLDRQNYNTAREFWNRYLNGGKFNEVDKLNNALIEPSVTKETLVIPEENTNKITKIAKEHHLTVNNLLQAVWAVVLQKVKGESEVVFGSTIFGRPPQINSSERMVGLFINTLPLRVRFKKSDTLLTIAQKIQTDWAEMQEHGFLPLSEIKKQIEPAIQNDPFESIFVFTDQPFLADPGIYLPAIKFEIYEFRELTNYPFTIDVTHGNQITIQLSYPPSHVSKKQALQLIDSYQSLLELLVNSPDKVLSFNIGGEHEIKTIPKKQNRSNSSDPVQTTIEHETEKKKLEKEITEVWKEVLQIEDISPTDNYFELGGDSISCLRIVSKLSQRNYTTSLKKVFEHPTIRSLAKVVERTTNKVPRLSTFHPPDSVSQRIKRKIDTNVSSVLPLSYIQKSVMKDSLQGKSSLFHDQSLFEYAGNIDYELFERAWNTVVEKNSVLRSVFFWDNQQPVQAILNNYWLKLDIRDLAKLNKTKQKKRIKSFLKEDIENSFQLEDQPPIRITLFKLTNDRHVFILSFSVLLFDGWCFAFVLSDFYAYYKSLIKGTNYPEINRESYEKYIHWLASKDINLAVSYWKNYLKGVNPGLYVKRIELKISGKEDMVDAERIKLQPELIDTLKRISRKINVTLNFLFQTTWAFVLSKFSSKAEVLIGATVSGRPPELTGSDEMIGLFFNDLPVRFDFSKNQSLIATARKAQQKFGSSREYGYLATSQIIEAAGFSASDELFQSLFIFENYPKSEQIFLQSKKEFLKETKNWRREASMVDMNVYVEVDTESFIEIRYLRKLFDKQTIKKLLAQYYNSLSKMTK